MAERSDADDALRSAVDVGFESILTGNKGIFPKNVFSGFCDANSEENIHNI